MLATLIQSRLNREMLKEQLAHASRENRRALLVDAFGEYLECMESYNLLQLEIGAYIEEWAETHTEGSRDEARRMGAGIELSTREAELWDRWRSALMRIRLLGSDDAADLTDRLFGQYSNDMGEQWDGIAPTYRPGSVGPNQVIQAMQAALSEPVI
jgi:hypothetical protein